MRANEFVTESKIGPHEGNELNLMLAGTKPAALVGSEDIGSFKPYIKDKSLVLATKFKGGGGATVYAVTLPGEEWRGSQLAKQLAHIKQYPVGHPETKLAHTKMGLLLGYAKEDIRHFLQTRFN